VAGEGVVQAAERGALGTLVGVGAGLLSVLAVMALLDGPSWPEALVALRAGALGGALVVLVVTGAAVARLTRGVLGATRSRYAGAGAAALVGAGLALGTAAPLLWPVALVLVVASGAVSAGAVSAGAATHAGARSLA
jgi:hypothetical protein